LVHAGLKLQTVTAPELIFLAGAGGERDGVGMEGTETISPAQRGFGGSAPFPVAPNHSGLRFPFSPGDYPGSWRRGEPGEWSAFDLAQQFRPHECPAGALLRMEVTQRV